MAVGFRKIEFCAGSVSKIEFGENNRLNVVFEKRFSSIPIITLCLSRSNKTAFIENVKQDSFDIVMTDIGLDNVDNDFSVNFQAINVVR